MKLQKITNDRTGHITLEYDNGEKLSILWNGMSHTENHMSFPSNPKDIESIQEWWNGPWESKTVELMGDGKTVEKAIKDRGWDNPTWMTPLENLLDLLIELRDYLSVKLEPRTSYREMYDKTFYPAMLTSMDKLIYSNQRIAEVIEQASSKKNSRLFTHEECIMLYEWASKECYYRSRHNQEIQESIFNKVGRILEEYEDEEDRERE